MSDTSKCDGVIGDCLCVNRENCLRFTMKADDLFQSWLVPSMKDNGQCKYHISNYAHEKKHKDRKSGI